MTLESTPLPQAVADIQADQVNLTHIDNKQILGPQTNTSFMAPGDTPGYSWQDNPSQQYAANDLFPGQLIAPNQAPAPALSFTMILDQQIPQTRTYKVISPSRNNFSAVNLISREDIFNPISNPSASVGDKSKQDQTKDAVTQSAVPADSSQDQSAQANSTFAVSGADVNAALQTSDSGGTGSINQTLQVGSAIPGSSADLLSSIFNPLTNGSAPSIPLDNGNLQVTGKQLNLIYNGANQPANFPETQQFTLTPEDQQSMMSQFSQGPQTTTPSNTSTGIMGAIDHAVTSTIDNVVNKITGRTLTLDNAGVPNIAPGTLVPGSPSDVLSQYNIGLGTNAPSSPIPGITDVNTITFPDTSVISTATPSTFKNVFTNSDNQELLNYLSQKGAANNLPDGYLQSLSAVESELNPSAMSSTNARGLFQLTSVNIADTGAHSSQFPNVTTISAYQTLTPQQQLDFGIESATLSYKYASGISTATGIPQDQVAAVVHNAGPTGTKDYFNTGIDPNQAAQQFANYNTAKAAWIAVNKQQVNTQ